MNGRTITCQRARQELGRVCARARTHTLQCPESVFHLSKGPLPPDPSAKWIWGEDDGKALRASGGQDHEMSSPPPPPRQSSWGRPVSFVTLAFLAGIKGMAGESPPHSKPLGQVTEDGRFGDAELYSNWGSSTYKLCGPREPLPLSGGLFHPSLPS